MESFLSTFIDIAGLCFGEIEQHRTAFFEGMKRYRTLFAENEQIEALRSASTYIQKQYNRTAKDMPFMSHEVHLEIRYWQSKIEEAIRREQAKRQATMRPMEIFPEENDTPNDPVKLLKVDVARLIAAFKQTGTPFNPQRFAEAFNLQYDNSMQSLGAESKHNYTHDRIVRFIKALDNYLSPEERTELITELKKKTS